MGIKSDKTFEEIVERLVVLFRPQVDNDPGVADEQQPSSQTPVPPSPTNLSPTSSDEDTQ